MAPDSPSFFRRHRDVIQTILFILGLLALDLGAKAAYNTFNDIFKTKPEKQFRTTSPIYLYGLQPLATAPKVDWGDNTYPVYVNSLGLRDASPREVALKTDQPRVLLLGDSFLEGQFAFEETAAGLIADALRSEGIEVLNGGIVGSSASIYFARVRAFLEEGLTFHQVVVFLDISDPYDEAILFTVTPDGHVTTQPEPFTNWIRRNTIVPAEIVRGWDRMLKRRALEGQAHPEFPALYQEKGLWTHQEDAMKRFGAPGLALAGESMDRLATLLQSHHIPLTLVVYPWPAQVKEDDPEDNPQVRFWKEWSTRNGADFINLFPLFAGASWEETIKTYFIPGDVHWNREGNRIIADAFLKSFNRRIDPTSPPQE
jgi:hypothetical protein